MRTHLLWLLPLILLASSAQALKCHECNSGGNCYRPQSCPSTSHYCLIDWYAPPGQQPTITKSCAYTCPDNQQAINHTRAFCCNTDLCNSARSLHVSWGLLTLSILYIYLSQ